MNNNKFYTCKYDRPFKEVMLSKKNEDLLKWFLEDILEVKIENIEVQTIEMNNGNINIRRKYVDVMLKIDIGKIELEINAYNKSYVHPRNMAFISNIYSNHTLVGKDYSEEIPIIQINFSYGLNDNEKRRIYKMQDKSGKEYVKNLIIYEINMEYYKKIWHNGNKEEIDKNKYYIMLDLEETELEKISVKDRMVENYMEELRKVNSNPEFQAFMTYEEDQAKIFNSMKKESLKEGLEQGLQQGLQQGLEQGKKENSIEIAKNLKEMGLEIDKISIATNLTKEELNNIFNKD